MGARTDQQIKESLGPGQYSPEKADSHTKPKIKGLNFGKSGRDDSLIASDRGPGTYDDPRTIGKNLNRGHMGARLDQKIKESLGPGQYSPEKADSHTKPKIKGFNFGKSGRDDSLKDLKSVGKDLNEIYSSGQIQGPIIKYIGPFQ